MSPTITIHPATPSDIPTLISILFSAFANDELLVGRCYPHTPANHAFWVRSVQAQMGCEGALVFKAVLSNDNGDGDGKEKIIGWAKWLVQKPATAEGVEGGKSGGGSGNGSTEERQGALDPNHAPSEDMDMDACRKLADGQYSMLKEVIGERGCYWLNAIAVHPSYQRQGAATMLVAAGTELADRDELECFSACTTQANENMKGVLSRAGFDVVSERPVVGGFSVFAGHRKAKGDA